MILERLVTIEELKTITIAANETIVKIEVFVLLKLKSLAKDTKKKKKTF